VLRFVIIALAVTFLRRVCRAAAGRGVRAGVLQGHRCLFRRVVGPEALSAIRLTLLIAAISVGLNLVFGLIAAWAIAKFEFSGKTF